MNVAQGDFVKGQDIEPKHKYVSTQQQVNIPPSEMLQRTAADIVGVPNKTVTVQPVHIYTILAKNVRQHSIQSIHFITIRRIQTKTY